MKNHWRKVLAFMPDKLERKFFNNYFSKEHKRISASNPLGLASNLTKQKALKDLQQKYQLRVLVETGTYLGDSLFALYPYFDTLYSIELSEYYYKKAKNRFKRYRKIHLLNGDSGKELNQLVKKISTPALFWLDGHYSGGLTAKGAKDCPVYEELNAIFSSSLEHVIVIDDARLFIGENDYPTQQELKNYVANKKPSYKMSIVNDAIHLLPA